MHSDKTPKVCQTFTKGWQMIKIRMSKHDTRTRKMHGYTYTSTSTTALKEYKTTNAETTQVPLSTAHILQVMELEYAH